MNNRIDHRRRRMLGAAVSSLGLVGVAPALAATQPVPRTPAQTRGPFYPLELPLDKDNDLVTVRGRSGTARGEVVQVVGRVLDERGRPLSDVRVEIWQCDANGRYHHPRDDNPAPLDPNFQGYGQFVTGADGGYRFRTIKPVAYPGRAPHIHFTLGGAGIAPLTTQMYVAGAPENAGDGILNGIRDRKLRDSVIIAFAPAGGAVAPVGEFNIVLAADGRFN